MRNRDLRELRKQKQERVHSSEIVPFTYIREDAYFGWNVDTPLSEYGKADEPNMNHGGSHDPATT